MFGSGSVELQTRTAVRSSPQSWSARRRPLQRQLNDALTTGDAGDVHDVGDVGAPWGCLDSTNACNQSLPAGDVGDVAAP
jgi:hypothetical protein